MYRSKGVSSDGQAISLYVLLGLSQRPQGQDHLRTARKYYPVSRSLVPSESVSWSLSTSSHRPDNLSGKTTFLLYYLVRELARGQPATYFLKGYLYIFTQEGVPTAYFHKGNLDIFTRGVPLRYAMKMRHLPCGRRYTASSPDGLTTTSPWFILAASSPRSDRRRWVA